MTVALLAHAVAIVVVAVAVHGRRGHDRPEEAAYVVDAEVPVEGGGELTESCCEGPECVCYTRPWCGGGFESPYLHQSS